MVTEVRGRLTGVGAAVTIAEIMNESKGDVTIYIASVEFGNDTRGKHIRSAEVFDVATDPTATFRLTYVDWQRPRRRD